MNEKSITVSAFRQAEAMLPYILKTYGILMADMEITEDAERGDLIVETIREFVAAHGKAPRYRDLEQRIGRRRQFGTKEAFRKQVEELAKAGYITEVQLPRAGSRGPQPTGWVVNE